MTDIRALLKAKRQEAHVAHPFAAYSASGQLRCTACGTIVKHASAWQGHLGSKLHRTSVTRLKEEELRRKIQREEGGQGEKRKADDQHADPERTELKRPGEVKEDFDTPKSTTFPHDFFSNASRELVPSMPPSSSDSQDGEDIPQKELSTLDLEWEMFQRDVVNVTDDRETFDRATLAAEPELVSQTTEGIPIRQTEESQMETSNNMDDETTRRKREQDERELIMDRLLDEERAQEDADLKVSVLKNRLDALKQKRRAARVVAKSGMP